MAPPKTYGDFIRAVDAGGRPASLLDDSISLPQFEASMMPLLYVLAGFYFIGGVLVLLCLVVLLRHAPLWVVRWKSGIWIGNTRLWVGATLMLGVILALAAVLDRILIYYGRVGFRCAILFDCLKWVLAYQPCFYYAHGLMVHLVLSRPAPVENATAQRSMSIVVFFLNASFLSVPCIVVFVDLSLSILADSFFDHAIDLGEPVVSALDDGAALEPFLSTIQKVYESLRLSLWFRNATFALWAALAAFLLVVFLPSLILHVVLLFRLARARWSGLPSPQGPWGVRVSPSDVNTPDPIDLAFVFTPSRLRRALSYEPVTARTPAPASMVPVGGGGFESHGPEPGVLMLLILTGYLCGLAFLALALYGVRTDLYDRSVWELCHKVGTVGTACLFGVGATLLVFRPTWKLLTKGGQKVETAARPARGVVITTTTVRRDSFGTRSDQDRPVGIELRASGESKMSVKEQDLADV